MGKKIRVGDSFSPVCTDPFLLSHPFVHVTFSPCPLPKELAGEETLYFRYYVKFVGYDDVRCFQFQLQCTSYVF